VTIATQTYVHTWLNTAMQQPCRWFNGGETMSVVEKRERKSILVSCGSNAHRDLGPPFLGLPNTSAAQSGAHGLKSPYVQRVKIGGQREKDTVQVDEREPTPPPPHTHTHTHHAKQDRPKSTTCSSRSNNHADERRSWRNVACSWKDGEETNRA
jgi:hypothetical protein